MNRSILIPALLATLSLVACDKPTVVNVPAPAAPVTVPGPAGPAGPTGSQGESGYQGDTGKQGETGKTGDSNTVIVVPAESTN